MRQRVFVLLTRLRHLQAFGNPANYLIPDDAINAFMTHCSQRIGDSYFRTPRTTIISFLGLLSVLEQNPEVSWSDLVKDLHVEPDRNPDLDPLAQQPGGPILGQASPGHTNDDELTSFKI
jgi:hypothetical protein